MDTTTEQGRNAWLDKVYSNAALVTMIGANEAGATTVQSSSSMPSLMTRTLESVTPHGQSIWLDDPDGPRRWQLCAGTDPAG